MHGVTVAFGSRYRSVVIVSRCRRSTHNDFTYVVYVYPIAFEILIPQRYFVESSVVNDRFLGTGDQTSSIALDFRVGESTVRMINKEVCSVTVKILQPLYLFPPTKQEWIHTCF
ncbi:uncharacterized protein [Mycetomoellerius zeteki]|uniref:uncharacterized protein n=1 Tax=Mycetomoellerius zeteki TaxID=64791 RepID=UPI00084E7908|nr:PREDICTED: uncharacterized protein LOC108725741 [Trachymyrmex zeteki]